MRPGTWTQSTRPEAPRSGKPNRNNNGKDVRLEEALAELELARDQSLRRHFGGMKFTLKFSVLKNIAPVGKDAEEAAKEAGSVAWEQAKGFVLELLKQIFENVPLQEILELLTENVVVEIAAQVVPFIGPALNLTRAMGQLSNVAKDAFSAYKLSRPKVKVVLSPTGVAALDAVKVIVKRRIARSAIEAARFGAAGLGQTVVTATGYGTAASPAIGVVNALTGIVHKLVWLAIEYYEVRAANKLLKHPEQIDLSIFDVCPLMGCYALSCGNTSDIVNFVVADMGRPGWNKDVEKAMKIINPILVRTQLLMYNSSYEMTNPRVDQEKAKLKKEGDDWRHSHPALGRPFKGEIVRTLGEVSTLSYDSYMARFRQKTFSTIRHPQRTYREWAASKVNRMRGKHMEGFGWDPDTQTVVK